MKVSEAIAKADAMRPNAIDEIEKARWVMALEGDMCETWEKPLPKEEDLYDPNYELIVPFPKDECYPLYLCAMIDNAHEETTLYANDMTVANGDIAEAKAWYRRHNRIKHPIYIRGL